MGKIRVTKKAINEGFRNIICVGYCNLQHLLYYTDADFVTVRAEGWGADIYKIDYNTVIVTGYAPFGNIRPCYDLQEDYDRKACAIVHDRTKDFNTIKKDLAELLEQFVAEVLENEKNK
jgi:hypothetical protein